MKGQIRIMYHGRKIFFCCFGLLLGLQCMRSCISSDREFYFGHNAFWPGVLLLLIAMVSFVSIFYEKTDIEITSKGIILQTKFSTQRVLFSEIVDVKQSKVIQTVKSGQITDGYTISVLILKNTENNIIISPDVYNNYHELMHEIRKYISSRHEA